MPPRALGIRTKLILIFVFIKVLPLVALAWFAWHQIEGLGRTVEERTAAMMEGTRQVVAKVGEMSTANSIRALDLRSREAIERLTTDTARAVADFLRDRDRDILLAAQVPPDPAAYRAFLSSRMRTVMYHGPWVLNAEGTAWVPAETPAPSGPLAEARLADNVKDFHSRPPEPAGRPKLCPLYLEMTFVDLDGRERIKVTTSDVLPPDLRDVSKREKTWCRAETYFQDLPGLGPGDIHVSEVIGPYTGSNIIGPYTLARAKEKGVPFEPEKAGYAGKENPVGRRFQGLVRWATPVFRHGALQGWVTLALDHTHIMEFTDHILPTEERYSPISDAATGNYAFMWDYKDRCISHPRDHSIVGFDPATGLPAQPWMDTGLYDLWQKSGLPVDKFLASRPVFEDQCLEKKGSPDMVAAGLVGLDGRYLNFAPQCAGWHNLTKDGGSGSFVIFWSGLWKLTTAAAIPYHTGRYAAPAGFGYVTIGANVNEFHRSATQTAEDIEAMAGRFEADIETRKQDTQAALRRSLAATTRDLATSTALMVVVVIIIAVWMASWLTRRITAVIQSIRTFQQGDLSHRLAVTSGDEMGQLAQAFNEMSDTILSAMNSLKDAEGKYRTIFENAVEGIFQTTPAGRLVRLNPAMAAIFGFDSPEQMKAEVTDINIRAYVSPQDRPEFLSLLREHGEIIGFEAQMRRRDGSSFWASISARAVFDEKGNILYTEGLLQNITERQEAAEALRRAKEEAEAASRMKSDFLSMVSHELRTPLTSVLGFAKMIRKKLSHAVFPAMGGDEKTQRAAEQVRRNLDIILDEGDRLTHLINDVLDLTRLEAGGMDWHTGPVDVQRLLDRALAGSEGLVGDKGLMLVRDAPPNLPAVRGNQDRLIQVLINLVSNAIKFTDQGSVACRARPDNGFVIFSVADTGRGINPEHQERVFDRFSQLGDPLTDKPSGSGLGLAICKEIVTRHGGRIWVESEPGQGSVFSFTVPVYEPDGQPDEGPEHGGT